VNLTPPQLRVLRMIAEEQPANPFSAGVVEICRLPGRTGDAHRVAGTLIRNGLVTSRGSIGEYLYITAAGRAAIAKASA